MKELITMWRYPRMIALFVVTAVVYAGIIVPFQDLWIVPGFTGIRPAAVFPVIFSLLFGPAAAWGSALGNLSADYVIQGGVSLTEGVGFIANFFFGLVGYKLWGSLGPISSGLAPDFREGVSEQLFEYVVVVVVAAALCASIIGWGLETLGLFPFSVLGSIVVVNNTLAALVLGPVLLFLLYPLLTEQSLVYWEIMPEEAISQVDVDSQRTAAYGIAAVAITWAVVGNWYSILFQGIAFGAMPFADVMPATVPTSTFQVAIGAVAFLAVLAVVAMSGERLSDLARSGQSDEAATVGATTGEQAPGDESRKDAA